MPSSHSFPPYIIPYPFELYVELYLSRFPKHDLFPFILDSEILEEHHDEETGHRSIKRKVKLNIDAPTWFKKLSGIHYAIFIENTEIDYKQCTMTIRTVNETLSERVLMNDITYYKMDASNPGQTEFQQSGKVEFLKSILGLQKKVEEYFIDLYISRFDESRKLDEKMIALQLQRRKDAEDAKGADPAAIASPRIIVIKEV